SIKPDKVLWYVVNINFKSHVSVAAKKITYAKLFYPARVTDLYEYIKQTLGDLVHQIKQIAILSVVITVVISVLITSLFLKLLVSKQLPQIAIMKALGFSQWHIRVQYLTKALFVLNLGILFGALLCNTLGQQLVGIMWSFMGAAAITFIVHPIQVYILCPLLLIIVVSLATLGNIVLIKKSTIMDIIV
ncbi:MAG TPA: ABC transporter permease, partial [Legionellaceae bacterium]|nr:ABC transporter permease [Legionellaceae bacterium]